MKYLVLGGYGAMGKIIVKDLFKTTNDEIIIAGRDLKEARNLAKSYKSKRVNAAYADVKDQESMIKIFRGSNVVIHAVHHEFNLNVMKACLKSRTHYIDLGGLYHYTKKQLKLNKQFKKANLIAVLGIGASPGITNVLARYALRFLDKIENIEIKIGYKDFSTYRQVSPLSSSYSIQTILELFSWRPTVFVNGKVKFVEPISGREKYKFPEPIGLQKPQYTIHSEIATLPYTLKAKNVSFKIAFDEDFVDKIKTLSNLDFLSENKVLIMGKEFITKDISVEILKRLPTSIPEKINEYEIIRVIVDGKRKGKKKRIILDAKIKGINETIDKDTGVPPSIVAQMVAKGKIVHKGVFPPESIIPENQFFKELAKRKIYIYKSNKRIN